MNDEVQSDDEEGEQSDGEGAAEAAEDGDERPPQKEAAAGARRKKDGGDPLKPHGQQWIPNVEVMRHQWTVEGHSCAAPKVSRLKGVDRAPRRVITGLPLKVIPVHIVAVNN